MYNTSLLCVIILMLANCGSICILRLSIWHIRYDRPSMAAPRHILTMILMRQNLMKQSFHKYHIIRRTYQVKINLCAAGKQYG